MSLGWALCLKEKEGKNNSKRAVPAPRWNAISHRGEKNTQNCQIASVTECGECGGAWGFPGGSDGKESACSAGDPGLIPGWEDPLEEGMATYSSILAWRIPMDRGAWRATVHSITKSWTRRKWLRTQCITYLTIPRLYLTNEYSIPISNLPEKFHGQGSLVGYHPQVCSQTWATEPGVASLIFLKLEKSILGVISIILFACIVLGEPKY